LSPANGYGLYKMAAKDRLDKRLMISVFYSEQSRFM